MRFVIDYGNAVFTATKLSSLDEREVAIFSMLKFLNAKEMITRNTIYRIYN